MLQWLRRNPALIMKRFTQGPRFRRLLLILTLGAALGIFVIPLNPVNSTFFRLAHLGMIAGAWFGLLWLAWKHPPARYALLAMPALLAICLSLPAPDPNPEALRADYVKRMEEMSGTKYVWGGENPRGIDCSGLPRRALRDALLAHAFRHANGRALRMFAGHWWFDASARALSEGYRGYTVPLGSSGTISTMSYQGLLPGDLAVTEDGVHILAYLGGDLWIQADPGIGAVAILNGREDPNGWFGVPVTTYRWKVLAPAAEG